MYWSIRHVLEIEKYIVRFFSLKSFSFALLYNKLPFIEISFISVCIDCMEAWFKPSRTLYVDV